MPVPAPADRRFRRKHVRPGRRLWLRRWGKRFLLVVLVLAAGVYVFQAGRVFATSSQWLTVSKISVQGNSRMPTASVQRELEGLVGTNILMLDIDAWRRRLRALPWVADVAIRRQLPDTVAVLVSERTAAAIGRLDGGLFLIDQKGEIIDPYGPAYAGIDLPIVDGLAAGRSSEFPVDEERARVAARLFAALRTRPDIAGRVSQIDVSDPDAVGIVLKGDTAVVRVGNTQFIERLQSYIELAPLFRESVPEIESVDFRYDERAIVKPLPGSTQSRRGPRADKG
ncbi:MAG TPA: FtsQ-type POTRA domain-containing protein [Vicinamibacterales bacterium]|nr:FtsQ-type POTRA domain-containing protein [Vicinamibacterales bacterium]